MAWRFATRIAVIRVNRFARIDSQKIGSGRSTVGKCAGPKMVQNGPNDHFGQNGLIPNWILAFARPKWTKMVHFGPFWPEEVHFGPFRSANRALAIPEKNPYFHNVRAIRTNRLKPAIRNCSAPQSAIRKKGVHTGPNFIHPPPP